MDIAQKSARLAGWMYLGVAILGTWAFLAQEKALVPGDPAGTAARVLAEGGWYHAAMLAELVMAACWLLAAYHLQVLFKPVRTGPALLMLILVAIGAAVICVVVAFRYAAWALLAGTGFEGLETGAREALALLFLGLAKQVLLFNHLCFGGWLLPLGWFVLWSGRFPLRAGRVLASLLWIAGAGYLADMVLVVLVPDIGLRLIHYTFIGEVLLLLWLLVVRVRPAPAGAVFPECP